MERYNKNATDLQLALWSLHVVIVHDARDWAANGRDARVWALAIGWDDATYVELQRKFGWPDETVAALKKRHAAIEAAKGDFPEAMAQR